MGTRSYYSVHPVVGSMDPLLRLFVIVAGIASLFGLLILNKYVAKHYWLASIENDQDAEYTEN